MWPESIKVSYHPAKVSRRRHYGIEDRIILVCHVVSQDHVSKGHVTLWEIKAYPIQRANLRRFTSLKKIFTIQSIPRVCVCITEAHSENQASIKIEIFTKKCKRVFTIFGKKLNHRIST